MLFIYYRFYFNHYFIYQKGEKKMTYIYDLLLNFQDINRLVEFFEWSDQDVLEHVKKIPLFRIKSIDMDNICFGNIKIENSILEKIKTKTLLYKKRKTIAYATLFCDLNRVIAVEFSNKGEIIAKSCLLLDEEMEVLENCKDLKEEELNYKVMNKKEQISFLTRKEEFQQRYLLEEIKTIFNEKSEDKLIYLYEEIFGKDNISMLNKYNRLIKKIKNNFDNSCKKLYEVVRLSYSKK